MGDAEPHARLVVEPVGPAGCGKTTLLRTLLARDENVIAGVRLRRLEWMGSLFRVVGLLGPLLPRAIRDRTWFRLEDVRSMIYLDAWHRELQKTGGPDAIVFLDHGPIFRLARLDEFGPPASKTTRFQQWWCARLADWGGMLDLVVHLDAPEPLLIDRIRKRSTPHVVKEQADERGRALLLRYRRAYERVLSELARRCQTRVVRFDTSQIATDSIADFVLDSRIQNGGGSNGRNSNRVGHNGDGLGGRRGVTTGVEHRRVP